MDLLFSKGASHNAYPVKLMALSAGDALEYAAQAMFVAPKRSFKHAHDRNTLKRRMREVYRLNKAGLYEALNAENRKAVFAFIYTSRKIEEYAVIEAAIKKLLEKFLKSAKSA